MVLSIIIISTLSLGSFGNNIISYFAYKSNFEKKRSICLCGERFLKVNELIPVLSFLFLKGRCGDCKAKLPIRYIFIEIITAALGIMVYFKYKISLESIVYFFILFSLLIIGTIDLIAKIIPNKILIFLFFLSILKHLLFPSEIIINIIFSVTVTIVFVLCNIVSLKKNNKEIIGFGDIKLIGILFFLFNFPFPLIGIWLASLLGIVAYLFNKSKNEKIPFGFYLSISFILLAFLNQTILLIINFVKVYGFV